MPNIYYIRPDGDNSHSGTGYTAANAWATLAKAVSMVAAGDIVRIAPGTYREIVTIATNGTLANPIMWWGDKEAQYFTDMNPGYVRITGCDVNEFGQSTGAVFNCNSKAYQVIRGFVIDGGKSAISTYGIYNGTTSDAYDCIIQGVYQGIRNFRNVYRCIITSSNYGTYSVLNVYNSITIGCTSAFAGASYVYNCLAVGGNAGFAINQNVINCTAYGGTYGFYNIGTYMQSTINCKAIGCQYGFAGSSTYLSIAKGKSISCQYGTYGTSNTALLDISDCKHSNCYAMQRGGGYDTGTMIAAKFEGFTDISRLLKIVHALRYDLYEEGTGAAQVFTENYDIEGLPRIMGTALDLGAHEYSNNYLSFTEYRTFAPSIQINNIGTKRLTITVKNGVPKTISTWVKFNLDSGVVKPQLYIWAREDILTINPISVSATGAGTSYEQLSSTFTPKSSGLLFIEFKNMEIGSSNLAVANFSDIQL